jgi:flagellar biosynthesis/type III secretory pathway M-ring protein FliF/YscJ
VLSFFISRKKTELNDVASLSNAAVIGLASGARFVGLILAVPIIMIIRNRRNRINDKEEVEMEPVVMTGTLDDELQSGSSQGRKEEQVTSRSEMKDDLDDLSISTEASDIYL